MGYLRFNKHISHNSATSFHHPSMHQLVDGFLQDKPVLPLLDYRLMWSALIFFRPRSRQNSFYTEGSIFDYAVDEPTHKNVNKIFPFIEISIKA
jgi:hypothetical protein